MDLELALLTTISRRLPHVRGAGALAKAFLEFYTRRDRPAVVASVRGFRMQLRPSEYVDGWLLFAPQYYEHPEVLAIARRLRPGDVFVDVGAYIGLYSLIAGRAVGPTGRVLAIEAHPESCRVLEGNLERNGMRHATAVKVGASSVAERLTLGSNEAGNRAGSSFLFPHPTQVEVECRPLLEILTAHGIDRIDGAKLDIEGFEFRVLGAFFATAPRSLWPRFLLLEFFPEWVQAAGGNALALLRDQGYRVVEQYPSNYLLVRD